MGGPRYRRLSRRNRAEIRYYLSRGIESREIQDEYSISRQTVLSVARNMAGDDIRLDHHYLSSKLIKVEQDLNHKGCIEVSSESEIEGSTSNSRNTEGPVSSFGRRIRMSSRLRHLPAFHNKLLSGTKFRATHIDKLNLENVEDIHPKPTLSQSDKRAKEDEETRYVSATPEASDSDTMEFDSLRQSSTEVKQTLNLHLIESIDTSAKFHEPTPTCFSSFPLLSKEAKSSPLATASIIQAVLPATDSILLGHCHQSEKCSEHEPRPALQQGTGQMTVECFLQGLGLGHHASIFAKLNLQTHRDLESLLRKVDSNNWDFVGALWAELRRQGLPFTDWYDIREALRQNGATLALHRDTQ